jgi:hypothetical protein
MPVLELTDEQAIALLEQLTEEQRQRVLARLSQPARPRRRRQFGIAKDDILHIAEDFDAPLEDFREYM